MKKRFRDFKIRDIWDIPKKFHYAWEGLVAVIKYELSFRIELAVAAVVVAAGFFTGFGRLEWIVTVLGIAAIFTAEFMNTAVEKLADHLHPEEHPEVKAIKDISAAGVMIANIAAIIIALLLFIPRIFR